MNEEILVQDIWPQLEAIAAAGGFEWVTRLELTVGTLTGVAAAAMEENLESRFDETCFEGAIVRVTLVEPMCEIPAPGRADTMVTTGWEMLITRIEGRKAKEQT